MQRAYVGLRNFAAGLFRLPRKDVPFHNVEPAAIGFVPHDVSTADRAQFFRVEPIVHWLIGKPFCTEALGDGFRFAVEPGAITH